MKENKVKMWADIEQTEEGILDFMTGRIKNSLGGFLRICLVALIILGQIALLLLLPYWLRQYTVYFYVIVEIASLVIIFVLLNDKRSPAYKIAWISICLAFPIAGEIMFLLWGRTGATKKIREQFDIIMKHGDSYKEYDKEIEKDFEEIHPFRCRMSKYLSTEGFPLTKNNEIQYFSMGEDVFEHLLVDLEQAKKYIFLSFFIVAEGAIWDAIHEVCVRKIKEGVEVKFLYDDFGATFRTDKNFAKTLREEGFQVAVFNPIHKFTDKLYINYRTHQKIVVIDGAIGYTGGFNLADEYANLIERFGVWKDTGVRIYGDAVWNLAIIFLQMWELALGKTFEDFMKYKTDIKFKENNTFCHVIADGPLNERNNPIEMLYHQMINYTKKYLYVMTPYLIIEKDMQDALILAVKSGIDVRIITPFIPDKKSVKLVTNYNYGFLLKHGVRIFEYTPGFLHAKCIINEDFGIIGSINMDYRSFYLHFENGIWISGQSVVKEMKKDFDDTFLSCKEITYEEWLRRPVKTKIEQAVLNIFATLL